nr:MAG TPA: hypothetical protein [Caudoviricetes sp.]
MNNFHKFLVNFCQKKRKPPNRTAFPYKLYSRQHHHES